MKLLQIVCSPKRSNSTRDHEPLCPIGSRNEDSSPAQLRGKPARHRGRCEAELELRRRRAHVLPGVPVKPPASESGMSGSVGATGGKPPGATRPANEIPSSRTGVSRAGECSPFLRLTAWTVNWCGHLGYPLNQGPPCRAGAGDHPQSGAHNPYAQGESLARGSRATLLRCCRQQS